MALSYRPKSWVTFEARQWTPDADPEELASWCDGWTYTGTQHGHTRPPWQDHTCLNMATAGDGKGHADPGDWIVRLGGDVYEVLSAEEFANKYEPAGS